MKESVITDVVIPSAYAFSEMAVIDEAEAISAVISKLSLDIRFISSEISVSISPSVESAFKTITWRMLKTTMSMLSPMIFTREVIFIPLQVCC